MEGLDSFAVFPQIEDIYDEEMDIDTLLSEIYAESACSILSRSVDY